MIWGRAPDCASDVFANQARIMRFFSPRVREFIASRLPSCCNTVPSTAILGGRAPQTFSVPLVGWAEAMRYCRHRRIVRAVGCYCGNAGGITISASADLLLAEAAHAAWTRPTHTGDDRSPTSLGRSFVHSPRSERERFLGKRQPTFVQPDSRHKPLLHRSTVTGFKVRSVSVGDQSVHSFLG